MSIVTGAARQAGRHATAEYREGTMTKSIRTRLWLGGSSAAMTLFLEGVNLTDEVRIENNNAVRRIGNETFGSRYFFGVRAKF
jgi:hypothetical protein